MTNKALQKAIEECGTQEVLADKTGVKQATISRWLKSRVTAESVLAVEAATGGKVTRHDLRPDLYPKEEAPT